MSRFSVEGSDAIIDADDQTQAEAFLKVKLIPLEEAPAKKSKSSASKSI
jgi:hypothetical protein